MHLHLLSSFQNFTALSLFSILPVLTVYELKTERNIFFILVLVVFWEGGKLDVCSIWQLNLEVHRLLSL